MSRLSTTKTLSPEAREVLQSSCCEGNVLRLPERQLDRKLYTEVADTIALLGGKWLKGPKHHLFPTDAREAIDTLLGCERLPPKNPFDYFPTPEAVADRMVQLADINWLSVPRPKILEPSAGEGHLARSIVKQNPVTGWVLDMVEIDPEKVEILERQKIGSVYQADFLEWTVRLGHEQYRDCGYLYNYILMNPPFTSATDTQAWAAHVEAALTLLAPGGRLVTVAPSGAITGDTKRHKQFWAGAARHYIAFEPCPEGAFVESGTGVRAVLMCFEKAGA